MVLIQKRNLTTPQAIEKLCSTLRVDRRQVGVAGLKDKQGVTRQWISIPRVQPADVQQIQTPDLQVLRAGLHRNKLRTGHLRGNRFTVVLHRTCEDALQRARAILDRLVLEGMPNYYGQQRFGRQGDNARQGLRILRGEQALPKDRFKRRLLVSAAQSQLFNTVLATRIRKGLHRHLVGGEVLQRTDSSGLFVSEDTDADQRRLTAGEVMVTGPIVGPRMIQAKPGSPARELEDGIIDQYGVDISTFAKVGRLARGGRRPLTVMVHDATVESGQGRTELTLRFALPAGAYATVLLWEVSKQTTCRP
jgi:tRNA pseudouridine13 synthase